MTVPQFGERPNVLHLETMPLERSPVVIPGSANYRKALPVALRATADVHIAEKAAAGCEMACDGRQCSFENGIAHVNQDCKCPYEVISNGKVQRVKPVALHQRGALCEQSGFGKFPPPLGQHVCPHLDPRVVAFLQEIYQGNSAPQRSAAEIEQVVPGLEPARSQKLDLELPLHLPQVGWTNQGVPQFCRLGVGYRFSRRGYGRARLL